MGAREIEDHLLLTYDSGQTALKKHGIIPAVGAVATVVGASAALWVTSSPLAAGIASTAAGAFVIAQTRNVLLQRKETRLNGPLAYVQKLGTLGNIRQRVLAEHRAALAAGRDMVEDL